MSLTELLEPWYKIIFTTKAIKVGSSVSEWLEMFLVKLQGTRLGPFFCNIFINDFQLFIKEADICNFTDHTLYACGKN